MTENSHSLEVIKNNTIAISSNKTDQNRKKNKSLMIENIPCFQEKPLPFHEA